MSNTTDLDHRLTRFLLGDLSDEARQDIERQCLDEDGAVFAELVAIEDELRFDYLLGRLLSEDRKRFERQYLGTPAGQAKLAFARALLDRANASEIGEGAPAGRAPRLAWWRRPAFQAALAAAAVVLAVLAAIEFSAERRLREQVDRLSADLARAGVTRAGTETEFARLRDELAREQVLRKDLEAKLAQRGAARPATAFALTLVPGLTRGAGQPIPRVDEATAARGLQLTLTLPSGATSYAAYRVVILNADGREVWSGSNVRAGTGSVAVGIPASTLPRGDYEIVLRGASPEASPEDIASYYLRVS